MKDRTGVIAWFVRNPIASNLLMLAILLAGLFSLVQRTQYEVFPTVFRDQFVIETTMNGASQLEMDSSISRRIESAIQGIGEITSVRSYSNGSYSQVSAELAKGADSSHVLEKIKNELDNIDGFPKDASRPQISVKKQIAEVIGVAVWGDMHDIELLRLAQRVRSDLLAIDGITSVILKPNRMYQIVVEATQVALQKYDLTMNDLALAIERGSNNMVAGTLQQGGRELLLRSRGQAYSERDFKDIPVITRPDGAVVNLGDVASVYNDLDQDAPLNHFNGQPGLMLQVYRVGEQSAISISNEIHKYVKDSRSWLPNGTHLTAWRDMSEVLKKRISTMLISMLQGGILVVILLSLFLRPTVSFWVSMSIPVTIIGSATVMSLMGVSINVVTLFAFILVLGFVVDDAIVTGENIHTHVSMGKSGTHAAIDGTKEVSVPVTFGILTSIVAFIPLAMDPSARGQLFAQIPAVVIPILLFSWITSKLILPAKLKNLQCETTPYANKTLESVRCVVRSIQNRVTCYLELFIQKQYKPCLDFCLKYRYLTLASVAAMLIVTVALIQSGHMRFLYFPNIPSETAKATLRMPAGSLTQETSKNLDTLSQAAIQLQQKYVDEKTGESAIKNIYSSMGNAASSIGAQVGEVMMELQPPENRDISIDEVIMEWNSLVGVLPGARDLRFSAEAMRSEPPLEIQLSGASPEALRSAAQVLEMHLLLYPNVHSINNSADNLVNEIEMSALPQANIHSVGIAEIANQVRQNFHGFKVQQLHRAGEEVSVILRRPIKDRLSLEHLQNATIKTGTGDTVYLADIAKIRIASNPEFIERINQKYTVRVSAEFDKSLGDFEALKRNIERQAEQLIAAHPGMVFSLEGEDREQQLSLENISIGLIGALLGIYALLAIPFRSYLQPLIVMSVIPFGLIGAAIGHTIMGLPLSMLSIMGIVALVGIGVNDSLVLVDYINTKRKSGTDVVTAAKEAGVARFRPVLLTTLTTFSGFLPLMLETTTQAQWLIPMAVSLGYGIIFTSLITLIVIPCNYLIGRDMRILQVTFIKFLKGEPTRCDIPL